MYGCAEGMRYSEEGNDGVIVSGPWIQTKVSKRVARVLEAEEEERKKREQREQEKITNNSDSDLSDSEGDGLCAKLRPYIPKGHPRTEADIDDDDGDVVKPKIRKRLIHDDSDDERVFGGKDSEDEDSDEDNEAQKEIEGREKNERELQLEEEQRAIQKRREVRSHRRPARHDDGCAKKVPPSLRGDATAARGVGTERDGRVADLRNDVRLYAVGKNVRGEEELRQEADDGVTSHQDNGRGRRRFFADAKQ